MPQHPNRCVFYLWFILPHEPVRDLRPGPSASFGELAANGFAPFLVASRHPHTGCSRRHAATKKDNRDNNRRASFDGAMTKKDEG